MTRFKFNEKNSESEFTLTLANDSQRGKLMFYKFLAFFSAFFFYFFNIRFSVSRNSKT